MPSKNIVKHYFENSYYHIYNRGVEKRDIFLDNQDYVVYQRYLKLYLGNPDEVKKIDIPRINIFLKNNLYDEVDLLAFALMPNHIHLLLKQKNKDSIAKLMNMLSTSYVMYFNRKYKRVGSLFQNTYKAAHVETDPYLLHLSRYIHLNPEKIKHKKINFTEFCSLPYYLDKQKASWVNKEIILSYFTSSKIKNKGNSYENFVQSYKNEPQTILGDLIIEKPEDMF